MSRSVDSPAPGMRSLLLAAALIGTSLSAPASIAAENAIAGKAAAQKTAAKPAWSDIGRPATTSEIRAWDIDVRPDFKGLPAGSGSVADGQDIWDAKCASCHGTFGESNEVFAPIVGGTTAADIETGRVANLARADFPQRTTMMKLSQLSSLWDYIRRAMPWNAPKSLRDDEVYAVTAYILHLADVVDADFVLSNRNMMDVQRRLPNRDGMVLYEGLWRVGGKPDVQGDACVRDCTVGNVSAPMPEHARNAHGNLAAQHRVVGPVRGADTSQAPLREPFGPAAAAAAAAASAARDSHDGADPADLAQAANCLACHSAEQARVGPSFRAVGEKYRGSPDALELLAGRVKNGSSGVWGQTPMPANAAVDDGDVRVIVKWILDGAP